MATMVEMMAAGDDGGDDGGSDRGGGSDRPFGDDREGRPRADRAPRSGGNFFDLFRRPEAAQPRTRRIARAAPPPTHAPEIVADLAAQDLLTLQSAGYRLIESIELPGRLGILQRLGPPDGIEIEAARDRIRSLP